MNDYSVLVTVALPSSGPVLLRVARLLAPAERLRVAALHCWTDREFRSEAFEHVDGGTMRSPLLPLLEAAGDLDVDPICFVSSNVASDILAAAHERFADLVLMGWHRPLVHDNEASGTVQAILDRAPSDVAVLLPRQFREIRRILVPFSGGRHDRRALELAVQMAHAPARRTTILHVVSPASSASRRAGLRAELVDETSANRVRVRLVEHHDPVEAAVREAWMGYDLIVAGASETREKDGTFFSEGLRRLAFATPASLLVVRARVWRNIQPAAAAVAPGVPARFPVNAASAKTNRPVES